MVEESRKNIFTARLKVDFWGIWEVVYQFFWRGRQKVNFDASLGHKEPLAQKYFRFSPKGEFLGGSGK